MPFLQIQGCNCVYADKSSPVDLSGITHLLNIFAREGLDFNYYFKIS